MGIISVLSYFIFFGIIAIFVSQGEIHSECDKVGSFESLHRHALNNFYSLQVNKESEQRKKERTTTVAENKIKNELSVSHPK